MHVPVETLESIFQFLEGRDLKCIRLVCHSYNICASRYLFDTVYMSAHHLDAEVLGAIAGQPLLSKHVKFLRYDASQFPTDLSKSRYLNYLSLELWWLLVLHRNIRCSSSDAQANSMVQCIEHSQEQEIEESAIHDHIWQKYRDCSFVEQGYQAFRAYAKRQYDSLNDMDYWRKISRLLRQFPNLQGAEIYDRWCSFNFPFGPSDYKDNHEVSTYGDILLKGSPLTRSWSVNFLRPLGWFHQSSISSPSITSAGTQEFAILNFVLHSASKQIRQLKTGNDDNRTCFSPGVMDLDNAVCATLLATSFWPYARLEILNLSIKNDWDGDRPAFFRPLTGLQALLYPIPGLRNLKLNLPSDNGTVTMTPYLVEQVFPSQAAVWPTLDVFEIAELRVDPIYLLALLEFGMPNLRSLSFAGIEVTSYTWGVIIECLRSRTNLSSFHVSKGFGLLYPEHKAIWSTECHVIDRTKILDFTEEHITFLQNIERYVIGGGQNPFESAAVSKESILESAEAIALCANNLAMEKWSA